MHSSIAFIALMAASSVLAKTIQIDVGKSGLVFSPDTSTADVGDTLEFHFYSAFHTAVQGDFSTPCQRGSLESTGFNSGPINNMASGGPNVFQVTVKDTNPIWFYCSTPSHCQSGMAGVVNPPSSGNSLSTYKSNAASVASSEGSTSVAGGQVVAVGTQPSAAPGSSSSSSPASSSAAAASSSTAASSAASVASSTSSTASVSASASSAASSSSSAAAASTTSAASSSASAASTSASAAATKTSGATSGQGVFEARGTWWAGVLMVLGVWVGLLA